jgi:hypothetical protein
VQLIGAALAGVLLGALLGGTTVALIGSLSDRGDHRFVRMESPRRWHDEWRDRDYGPSSRCSRVPGGVFCEGPDRLSPMPPPTPGKLPSTVAPLPPTPTG